MLDVGLETGTLKVVATLSRIGDRLVISEPKTDRARRTVPLSPAAVALLRKHKVAKAAEQLRAGDQRRDSGLVITTELRGPVDPRSFLRVIEVAAKARPTTGDVYGHTSDDAARAAIASLSAALSL